MSRSRDNSRDMRRLASLYNGVALEQLKATHWEVLVDARLSDEGVLELYAQNCRRPIEEMSLFGDRVSESRKRMVVSVNKCVSAIDYNTAWLALCVEGLSFDIEEITFIYPKPIHSVELWLCGNGRFSEQIRTDFPHTVLKFFFNHNDDEAIVADASYAQYSFDNGIDSYKTYCATKVRRADEEAIQEDHFGRSFEDRAAFRGDVWEESRADATKRTTNNVMVRELGAVGGIEALLSMSAEVFQKTRDHIFAVMRQETEVLRHRLEWIFHGDCYLFLMQVAELVEDCDGAGHRACMLSYQRRG